RLPEAAAAYRKAIEIDPKLFLSHGGLGVTLLKMGSFAEASQAFQKGADLLPIGHPQRAVFLNQLKRSQHLMTLAQKLPRVLEGKEKPAPDELAQMAEMCLLYHQRYATAAGLFQDAFTAKPALAEDVAAQFRYNAACAAVLGGTGQDKEPV